ncbi:MAG: LLM class flavin-dependent oxidoreductase [Chloroflexi bacterium]|nr:LLM class flavin-dependent oxidoreductase [Chloroflexota bacterium]
MATDAHQVTLPHPRDRIQEQTATVTHPWAGEQQVRFGVGCGPRDDWPALREFVQRAEELGFDSYSLPDHPMVMPSCWTTLAGLAAVTRRIRLLPLVSCVYYANPVILARMVADIDRMSDGRAVLGLGSGDMPREFAQMGLPYPAPGKRQAALEEGLQIIRPLLRGQTVTFNGEHFRTDGAVLRPSPVQQPYVPILIAGGGERTTLRYVAQYADASNLGAAGWAGGAYTPADVQQKLAVLRQHCTEQGRPYASILRSTLFVPTILAETAAARQAKLDRLPAQLLAFYGQAGLVASPEEAVDRITALVAAGFRYFIPNVLGNDLETLDLLARHVIPAVSG